MLMGLHERHTGSTGKKAGLNPHANLGTVPYFYTNVSKPAVVTQAHIRLIDLSLECPA